MPATLRVFGGERAAARQAVRRQGENIVAGLCVCDRQLPGGRRSCAFSYHLPSGLPGPLKLSTLSESAAAHGGAEAAQGRSRALSPAALPARPQVSPYGPSCGVVIRRCHAAPRHRLLRTHGPKVDIKPRTSLGSHLDIADSGLLLCFCGRTRVHCSRRHFCGPAVGRLAEGARNWDYGIAYCP